MFMYLRKFFHDRKAVPQPELKVDWIFILSFLRCSRVWA